MNEVIIYQCLTCDKPHREDYEARMCHGDDYDERVEYECLACDETYETPTEAKTCKCLLTEES